MKNMRLRFRDIKVFLGLKDLRDIFDLDKYKNLRHKEYFVDVVHLHPK